MLGLSRKHRTARQLLIWHVCMGYAGLTLFARGIARVQALVGSTNTSCNNMGARACNHEVHMQGNSSCDIALIEYVKSGEFELAIACYHKLQLSGSPFVALLKACTMLKDFGCGQELHAEIARRGLLEDIFVGSSLVDMYAKCASLEKAREVLDMLPVRNVVSWTALIAGYVEHVHVEEALCCMEQMQLEGISPNAHTLVCSLKACGTIGDTSKGREMHIDVIKKGFSEMNVFVGSALIDMYAKCGSFTEAQQVFDMLQVHNVVSWNTLITAFVEQGCGEEALHYFEQMLHLGIVLSVVTLVSSLKACSFVRSLNTGKKIHAEAVMRGLEGDLMIGNILIDMYGKCGALGEAQEVFNKITSHDVVSWTALIAGYAEHGYNIEALCCFDCAAHEGISLNDVAYVCTLKTCAVIGTTSKGQELHAEIVKKGFVAESSVGSTLIDMYAKMGSLKDAQYVFHKLPNRTIVCWNTLIAGYAEHGLEIEADTLFQEMQNEGLAPDIVTVACSLKLCSCTRQIHSEIVRRGFERDALVGNVLVDMYGRHGWLVDAHDVLNKLPERGLAAWTALIAGLIENGRSKEALSFFEQMQQESIALSAISYVCGLKACGALGARSMGQRIHTETARKGLERELFVGSTLIDMYCRCGLLAEAQEVFDTIPVHDVVSWNAIITGYVDKGHSEEALSLLKDMKERGFAPNIVTLVCILKICGSKGAMRSGREVHADIARKGLERECFIGNGLVDMYAKCGLLAEAQVVFDKLTVGDPVSWNTLMTGYVEHGHAVMALDGYAQMQNEGISLNVITFLCSLKACASLGTVDRGQELHAEIAKRGLEKESILGTVLVDMYATCGLLVEAQVIFNELSGKELSSWNALIAGYAQLGDSKRVLHIFERMVEECLQPNSVTFVSALNACSRSGLVDEGLIYFEAICNNNRLIPTLEHYNCLIDILGRAGQTDKLVLMIEMMPFHPGIVGWLTMLGACRKWINAELGSHAFEHVIQMDKEITTAYVCMFNIFADAAQNNVIKENRKGSCKGRTGKTF